LQVSNPRSDVVEFLDLKVALLGPNLRLSAPDSPPPNLNGSSQQVSVSRRGRSGVLQFAPSRRRNALNAKKIPIVLSTDINVPVTAMPLPVAAETVSRLADADIINHQRQRDRAQQPDNLLEQKSTPGSDHDGYQRSLYRAQVGRNVFNRLGEWRREGETAGALDLWCRNLIRTFATDFFVFLVNRGEIRARKMATMIRATLVLPPLVNRGALPKSDQFATFAPGRTRACVLNIRRMGQLGLCH